MNKRYKLSMLLLISLLMGAGIPNFFAGLIGDNVKDYCDMTLEEQKEMMKSVNLYTGTHEVVVVCGEKLAQAEPVQQVKRSHRIAR